MWLIYALGGGFGHLTRAVALARVVPPNIQVRILTNSPYADGVRRAIPELDLIVLDATMRVNDGRGEVRRQIASAAPECLIVDTFPRGLAGELVEILPAYQGRKVLVQRDLNPRYAAAYDLDAFAGRFYDLVLSAGDGPATTAPWLVRSPHELPSREAARRLLGLREDKPCVVICAAGNPDELAWYGEVTALLSRRGGECEVRCISVVCPPTCPPECWLSYWPAIDLYAAADVVIGGAGYNTVYECLACGVPLVARPWPRKYDRQHLRARRAARVVGEPQQAVAAALAILDSLQPRGCPPQFENGAIEAVKLLHPISRRDIH